MKIPTQYRKSYYKASSGIIGRHKVGWITDGCFMVKTKAVSGRKVKLAREQISMEKINKVISRVDMQEVYFLEYVEESLMQNAGPTIHRTASDLLCVKLRKMEDRYKVDKEVWMVDKVYYDYFHSKGFIIATTLNHDHNTPLLIVDKADNVVGYLMEVRQ